METDPGAEFSEQPQAPGFPRRVWILGPVTFTAWIVGVVPWWRGWELFFYYLSPIMVITNLVAICEYLWILLAYQGHRRLAATWLLSIYWFGLILAFVSGVLGLRFAGRLCILISASVAVVMPFACKQRVGDAGHARP